MWFDRSTRSRLSRAIVACVFFAAALLVAQPGHASEAIKVGKAVATSWAFMVVDVGVGLGAWKKRNIDIEILSFAGDARLNQAMVSEGVDIGLAGGTNIGFTAKGAPVLAVAALLN
jgi:NitT/TauT family transport system substrate-binding protein